jgi:carboxyl-terminal processing protease
LHHANEESKVRKNATLSNAVLGVMVALVAFTLGCAAGVRMQPERGLRWIAQIAQLVPGAYTYEKSGNVPAPDDLRPLSTFWEARKELLTRFYRPIKDESKLTYGAIRGMLAAVDDPYTRLMEPDEFSAFQEENEGNFEGIGAELEVRERQLENGNKEQDVIVKSVIEDGPAEKRGLRPNDVIIGVDDKPVKGLRLDEVVDRIRGKGGTTITLTVTREGAKEPVKVPIVRDRIEYPVVEYRMKEGNIGYIWLRQFNRPAAAKMKAALQDLMGKGAKGIILDLSSNGGGLLDTAVEIESMFFNGGPAAYILERGKEQPEMLEANGGLVLPPQVPMVCLINGGSASASEILAGALQDRKRATLVGQNSFGKSKVQTIVQLGDNSAMLVTTALWLTPNKRDIGKAQADGKPGVVPDVPLEDWTPETKLTGGQWHDQQLAKAIEVLKKKMTEATGDHAARPGRAPNG